MKTCTLLILLLGLTGCSDGMPHDRVTKAEAWCRQQGLTPVLTLKFPGSPNYQKVIRVECRDARGYNYPVPENL